MMTNQKSLDSDQPAFCEEMLLYLQIIERIHLHNRPNGVNRQGDLDTLIGHQWSVNGQRTGGDHTKTATKTEI